MQGAIGNVLKECYKVGYAVFIVFMYPSYIEAVWIQNHRMFHVVVTKIT